MATAAGVAHYHARNQSGEKCNQLHCRDEGLRQREGMATCARLAHYHARSQSGEGCYQLHCWDQCLRQQRRVAACFGLVVFLLVWVTVRWSVTPSVALSWSVLATKAEGGNW